MRAGYAKLIINLASPYLSLFLARMRDSQINGLRINGGEGVVVQQSQKSLKNLSLFFPNVKRKKSEILVFVRACQGVGKCVQSPPLSPH